MIFLFDSKTNEVICISLGPQPLALIVANHVMFKKACAQKQKVFMCWRVNFLLCLLMKQLKLSASCPGWYV